ncbi:uncharacterized protein LOC129769262 [Toxorhynchites rutilus septentrionalis]|uniref:uncharacterized protein LOC129769262 n=1 Tax=Toxorhynchites rutilus septentrionalis TaxID=329112 RepID=UPI00247A61CA|nr:uncharacterized protein LOC129769262 [Toxorhynchites rutilus septentrionalis]
MGKVLAIFLAVVVIEFCEGFASPPALASVFRRSRRSSSFRCCNDGFDDTANHEKFTGIRQECAEELKLSEMSEDELLNNHENLYCLIECISKKYELADDQGNMLHEAMTEAVKEHFSVVEWKVPLLDEFIKDCFDYAEEEHVKHSTEEEGKCNAEGFHFAYCLWKSFTLACPDEMRDDSERCESIRDKLNSNERVSFWNNDIAEELK